MNNPYPRYRGFGRRVAYARRRIEALGREPYKDIYTRASDNCFEMYDGAAVVFALMHEATTRNPLLLRGIRHMGQNCFEHWEQTYSQGMAKQPEQLSLF